MTLPHPESLFDRDDEWSDLVQFVEGTSRLGIVWGPRRVGKSTLLMALTEATGGLYYEAVRQDPALSIAELGEIVGARLGVGRITWRDWSEAIAALADLTDCPLVVLDEFGYLCDASPELPSVVQRVVDMRRRTSSRTRLVLCGSSVAQLSHLLDRDQPLFGRAQMALVVHAFDVRQAARYWGVDHDPALAVQLHAVLGGLPGYRDVVSEGPRTVRGFDAWIIGNVLTPSSPLLEEDTLAVHAAGLESNVYRSVLAAVALGDQTPTGIASRVGRSVTSLARPIEKLVDARLLNRIPDPLRSRRSRYELADPFLVFHDAIIRPNRTRIRRRAQRVVWEEAQATWTARVLGPHFERICREVTLQHADELGLGRVSAVGCSHVTDPASRVRHELDLVATAASGKVLAIGEVKHTAAKRGVGDLARLDHLRSVLPNPDDRDCKIALYSASGFTADLERSAARRTDVELIGLARLYG